MAKMNGYRFFRLIHIRAANVIRRRGGYVTTRSLARRLKVTDQAIGMRLLRHPEWRQVLGVVSQAEARRCLRAQLYKITAQKLALKKEKVTKAKLARGCNVENYVVARDFEKMPELEALLSAEPEL